MIRNIIWQQQEPGTDQTGSLLFNAQLVKYS